MIPIYMDEHVPVAITIGLKLKGVDVLTAQADSFTGKPDSALLERATFLRRILFTHDDDLLSLAAERQTAGQLFWGLIYAHPLKVTIGICVKDIELISKYAEEEDVKNKIIFLPLRK